MRFTVTRTITVLGLLFTGTVQAHENSPASVEERTREADEVAIVDVAETSSQFETNEFGDRLIVTRAKLKVTSALKGKIEEDSPEIAVEGGTVGDVTLEVSDQPELRKGERLLVFLKGKKGRERKTARRDAIFKVEAGRLEGTDLKIEDVAARVKKSASRK